MNNYGNNPYDDDTKDKTKHTSPRKSMALTLGNAKLTGAEGDAALEEARDTETESTVGAVVKCLVAIFVYATVGWIFFNHHYGWTFVDCLYFAMVTVTTVGYGDLTPQDDPAHQLFVAMYAFLGVAIIAGFLSDLSMKVVAGVKKVAQKAKNEAIMESNALLMQHSSHKDLGETKRAQQQLRGSSGKGKKGKTGLMRDVNMVYNSAKDKFGIMVDLVLIFIELAFIWSCGAWMLQSTEGFTFVQGFYCSAITSVSVGYGDYFPSSQTGRLLFAFYIPLSVTGVLGSIHQIMNVAVKMQTVLVIKREPMTKIFTIDQDGNGEVSEAEYVLFMLEEMREVDKNLVNVLKSQFKALDADQSGALEASDFPDSLEVLTTTVIHKKQIQRVNWKVVPKLNYKPRAPPAEVANPAISTQSCYQPQDPPAAIPAHVANRVGFEPASTQPEPVASPTIDLHHATAHQLTDSGSIGRFMV